MGAPISQHGDILDYEDKCDLHLPAALPWVPQLPVTLGNKDEICGHLTGRRFHAGPRVCGDTATCWWETARLPLSSHRENLYGPGEPAAGEPFFPSPGVPKGDHKRRPPYPFLEMLEVFLPYSPPHHSNFPRVEQWLGSQVGRYPWVFHICSNPILLVISSLIFKISIWLWCLLYSECRGVGFFRPWKPTLVGWGKFLSDPFTFCSPLAKNPPPSRLTPNNSN